MEAGEFFHILLIQDNPDYVGHLRHRLADEKTFRSDVAYAMSLREGLKKLAEGGVDIVLLELSLPDSRGIETFERIQRQSPQVPVVLLTSLEDELAALQAVRRGAQDYLLKTEVSGSFLPRVIRHAVERQRMRIALLNMSLMDDLTGLYNRRGFYLLAEQQMKLANRTKREMVLLLADLNGLKQINDVYGHPQGDLALTRAGAVLKNSFRSSDILARIGGDEFAVLAVEASQASMPLLQARLNENFSLLNQEKRFPFQIGMTFGMSCFEPDRVTFLEQLILKADRELYESKKQSRNTSDLKYEGN